MAVMRPRAGLLFVWLCACSKDVGRPQARPEPPVVTAAASTPAAPAPTTSGPVPSVSAVSTTSTMPTALPKVSATIPADWSTLSTKLGFTLRYPRAVFVTSEKGAVVKLESTLAREGLSGLKNAPKHRFAVVITQLPGAAIDVFRGETFFPTLFPRQTEESFAEQEAFSERVHTPILAGYRVRTGAEGYDSAVYGLAGSFLPGKALRVACTTLGDILHPEIAAEEQLSICERVVVSIAPKK
ncbi:MAG: hypothetical protein HOO96_32955 [Polyangiaceae bacterium]|nr:hypothetical protein [Polyangiaceae bacterium]